jgi:hypothetical protein
MNEKKNAAWAKKQQSLTFLVTTHSNMYGIDYHNITTDFTSSHLQGKANVKQQSIYWVFDTNHKDPAMILGS